MRKTLQAHAQIKLLIIALIAVANISTARAALPPFDSQGAPLPSLAPMLDQVTPAVVNIATRGHIAVRDNPLLLDPFFQRFFDIPQMPRERQTQSLGSGVVIDAQEGYVITNHHVIAKADEIKVTLRDGRNFTATLVGSDPDADIALLQIPAENLRAVTLADSDRLRVGDFVVAIGNPFGLGQTVTSGIVSALGRSGLGIEGFENFIQTDASINPGNSGGALVNLRGELVGINTAILAPNGGNVGIGFAIPINMANHITAELVRYGKVRRGRLGIMMQDLTPELARAFNLELSQGVVVARVVKGSAADQAGLIVGDIITEFDNKPVRNSAELRNAIGLLRVGQNAQLVVSRDGKRRPLSVSIEAPEEIRLDGRGVDPRLQGAVFEEVDSAGAGTVIVANSVQKASPAWQLGLRPGDAIISINRRRVSDLEGFRALLRNSGRQLLHIQRGDGALFILLE